MFLYFSFSNLLRRNIPAMSSALTAIHLLYVCGIVYLLRCTRGYCWFCCSILDRSSNIIRFCLHNHGVLFTSVSRPRYLLPLLDERAAPEDLPETFAGNMWQPRIAWVEIDCAVANLLGKTGVHQCIELYVCNIRWVKRGERYTSLIAYPDKGGLVRRAP